MDLLKFLSELRFFRLEKIDFRYWVHMTKMKANFLEVKPQVLKSHYWQNSKYQSLHKTTSCHSSQKKSNHILEPSKVTILINQKIKYQMESQRMTLRLSDCYYGKSSMPDTECNPKYEQYPERTGVLPAFRIHKGKV